MSTTIQVSSLEKLLQRLRPLRSKSPLFDYAYGVLSHFYSDSLYRNSIFLMASTFIMSFLGFFFWMINARLYNSAEIGIATTLISTSTLIVNISLLGLNNAIVRFLPTYTDKNEFTNVVIFYTATAGIIAATIFVTFIGFFSPQLQPVLHNVFFALFFILFIAISTVNTITDSLFISYRTAQYVLIIYTIMSIARISGAVIFPKSFDNAVFYSYAISIIIAAIMSIWFLHRFRKYSFKIQWQLQKMTDFWKFSLSNYVSSIIAGVPTLVLPLFILNRIGPEQAAYHYIGMMIASVIFIIPQSITQSLFSEGSHNEKELIKLVKKTLTFSLSLLTIPVVIFLLFGKYLLVLFGKEYSTNTYLYLCLLVISAYPLALNYVCYSIVKIKKQNKNLVIVNVFNTIIFVSLYFYLVQYGLMGIGIAWLVGNIVAALAFIVVLFASRRQ